jgi:FtsH-binding integral membrane protein
MDYTKYNTATHDGTAYNEGLRKFILQVYNHMSVALVITGIVAMLASSSPAFMSMLYQVSPSGRLVGMAPLGWVVALAPLAFVFFFGMAASRMSAANAQIMLWIYSVLMGLSMSSIFLVYTGASIAKVFFITASLFGVMSIYGHTTKKDLTSFGSFLMMGLLGVILASVVNIFLKSPGLHFAMSIIGVLIFVGLTAYDTQKVKEVYYQTAGDNEATSKVAVMGALTLYLDFVNIFMQLLHLFGNRRDN